MPIASPAAGAAAFTMSGSSGTSHSASWREEQQHPPEALPIEAHIDPPPSPPATHNATSDTASPTASPTTSPELTAALEHPSTEPTIVPTIASTQSTTADAPRVSGAALAAVGAALALAVLGTCALLAFHPFHVRRPRKLIGSVPQPMVGRVALRRHAPIANTAKGTAPTSYNVTVEPASRSAGAQ